MLAEERSPANPGARCRTPRATSAPGAPTFERERQRFSRHPLLRRPKGALCSKPPNSPPGFPMAYRLGEACDERGIGTGLA